VRVHATISEQPLPPADVYQRIPCDRLKRCDRNMGDSAGVSTCVGGIIAAAQVTDALKDVFPLTARQQAANNLLMSLDALFIEALYEGEGVYAGRYDNEEIIERRRKLMQVRHDLEVKNFPSGDLPERKDLLTLAEDDAITYPENMFGQEN
jgi:hypothetical protein